MIRRALLVVAGLAALEFSAAAFAQPDGFEGLNGSVPRVPSLALSSGNAFSFGTAFDWVSATNPDFLPALSAPDITRYHRASGGNVASSDFSKDSSKEVVDMKRSSFFDYATGEVGFLYGKSSGKYGVESEQGYIIGEVGNDHLHISAGASYENVNGHLPRFVR